MRVERNRMFVGFGVDSALIIRTDLARSEKIGFLTEVVSASVYLSYVGCNGCAMVSTRDSSRDYMNNNEKFTIDEHSFYAIS